MVRTARGRTLRASTGWQRAGFFVCVLQLLALLAPDRTHGQERRALVTEEERNTVALYAKARRAAVHVNASKRVVTKFEEITPQSGVGTGFFLDPAGHVLTNYHVIEDSNQVEVISDAGQHLPARLVGTAPALDFAVLKVDLAEDAYQPLPFGDSQGLVIGQKVIAVGHPLALHGTLTIGIVSALGRTLPNLSAELQDELIQTDAAVSPGNSGGPLINSHGEVVGIVAAFIQGAQNVAFAIPIDFAKRSIPALLTMGHPYRPALGVGGSEITSPVADLFGLPVREGFLVEEVAYGSLAHTAGIRAGSRVVTLGPQKGVVLGGDIIVVLNEQKVGALHEIAKFLLFAHPGGSVTFSVYREGRINPIRITLPPMQMAIDSAQ